MRDLLEAIQQRHQEKLDQLQRGEADDAFLEGVRALIADLRQAGAVVADPAERGQLRALMRFWGNVLHNRTGVYPDTTLQPPDPARALPMEEPARPAARPFPWIAAAGVVIIVVAVIGFGNLFSGGPTAISPTPSPAATLPAVFARVLMDDASMVGGEAVFCRDVARIAAEVAMSEIRPEMLWHWEVRRGDEMVASQPEEPWGERGDHVVVPVLTGKEVKSGRYELRVYAADQLAGRGLFRVLETAPRIFDLQVADVPEPVDEVSRDAFEAGLRVIYLDYAHEGLCPGLELSHALYRDGEMVQRISETGRGAPDGQAQVRFQAPDGAPFPSGSYEVVLTLAGEEQGRLDFTVGEVDTDGEPPAFNDVRVALGAQPDGTPILPASDNRFDWNTKVLHAIFDYAGMDDGLRWSAVWMRNNQEVARQEGLWDEAAFGTEGTRWVTHYDERGRTLPGGTYSVTLYIENVAQDSAGFNVLYYTPPE